MAEENKINQTQNAQKDFTKKNKYDKKVERDGKEVKDEKEIKPEKADLKFNSFSVNTSISSDSTVFDNTKKVIVPESKPVIVEVKSDPVTVEVPTTIKTKVKGKVVSVSNLSYIVKTKEGKGILVTGEHNKKIGDII